ncbi:MAG TPA: hypothetical protein VEL75_09220, partial [Candidatus Methylomirabilis sp.]|nr:hypothetical protein [Candidatus Methylomirabilis sp.]
MTGVNAEHLVFFPRQAGGPRWFLWSADGGGAKASAVPLLEERGRSATARVVTGRLRAETVRGVELSIADGLVALAVLDADDLARVPASVATWSLAAKLALDLIARERV